MNINFRKSLRKSSRSSTFYLESFELYDKSLKNLSLDDIDKHSNSIPIIDFRENEFMLRIKPITSVIKYDLNSERSKGIIGQIVFTNFRLKFIPYSIEQNLINNNSNKLNEQTTNFNNKEQKTNDKEFNFPPFELISTNDKKIDENIEYINIYDLICQQNLLQIYCADFRCLEFQFRSSNLVKCLVEQLDQLIIKPIINNSMQQISQNLSPSISTNNNSLQNIVANRDYELTYLWTIIGSQFMFNYPKQWEDNEGYWYKSNNLLRITQANENYQLCKSLPASFITLKYYIADFDLLLNISSKMKGQRIPIITYSQKCKQKSNQYRIKNRFNNQLDQDNMLIRSGIMNKDVSYSLKQAIKSLNIIEVNELLPDKPTFHSIYIKLRDACFLHSNSNHFLSQIGKWMKLIYKVLSIVNDLSKVLNEESSLILMENNDNHWNILLSCLIQITLDKNRRTINGFNSLLSKEWIYLVGLRTNSTKSFDYNKLPDPILFTLFLDCVYQMINQNTVSFEFTSLYLIRCFDLSFIPYSAIVKQTINNHNLSNNSIINDKLSPFKIQSIKKQSSPILFSKFTQSSTLNTSSSLLNYHNNHNLNDKLSPILKNLTFTQTLFYFNPFYNKTNNITKLNMSSSILSIQFWRPLYLRWSKPFLNLNYYNQFFSSEYLYFRELIEQSNLNFKEMIIQSNNNSCKIDNLSIDNSLNNFTLNDTNDDSLEDSYEHF